MRVHDIGDARARKLYDVGIKSLAELRRRQDDPELKLLPSSRVGLKYVEDWEQRIPRGEITRIEWLVAHETAEVVAVRCRCCSLLPERCLMLPG